MVLLARAGLVNDPGATASRESLAGQVIWLWYGA